MIPSNWEGMVSFAILHVHLRMYIKKFFTIIKQKNTIDTVFVFCVAVPKKKSLLMKKQITQCDPVSGN